jgi:hypothetical protein
MTLIFIDLIQQYVDAFLQVRPHVLNTDTPKALANFSPGLERRDNPGYIKKEIL